MDGYILPIQNKILNLSFGFDLSNISDKTGFETAMQYFLLFFFKQNPLSYLSDKTGFETAIYFLFKTKSSILGFDFDLLDKTSFWTAIIFILLIQNKTKNTHKNILFKTKCSILALDFELSYLLNKTVLRHQLRGSFSQTIKQNL